MQTSGDADRIRTKNNMSPTPMVVGHNLSSAELAKRMVEVNNTLFLFQTLSS